ncbi:MAG: PAS domain S-box protein, partial [Caldilineaceae bacterium]|nr:PAS domain S-box protein [Caldilineaceae bacterium]
PVRNVELIGETPAQPGVQRSWLESLFPIYDADGTVSGINVVAEEITERKEAEQALRESEELRRLALEGAQLGTWTIDLRSGAAFWDSRYREIFGIAPTEPATNEKRIALIHPEDRAKAEEALARAMHPNSDGVYHVEKRVVWPDGTVHWVVTEGQVHFADVEGVQQPVRLIGVAQDITERRENEEELRYQGYLLQTVQDAIVSTDLNFTIRSWNQGAERAYGWSAEEAIGRRVVDLLATEYLQEGITPDVLLQTLFTTGSWQGEVIHHHKNGSAVFVSSIVIVLRDDDGNPTGAVAVNRDITAQKEAEAILARYQLLSNQARDIILFMRLDGQIVEANMAAVEAYGYDRATLLQMTVYDLRDPHTRTQILEQMIQANQEAGGRGIRF